MTLILEPAMEAKLREMALREGQDAQRLATMWLAESMARYERELAEDRAAIHEAVEDTQAGRERPYEEFMADQRRQYPDVFTP